MSGVTEPLYERYKEALRRGHVSALRGRLEQAAVEYAEAAGIAPERALPHTSLGSVLLKLGRSAEAIAAFGAALERAPRDESALAGRAEAYLAAGRPADAANDLDVLAGIHDEAGRSGDALDTARRAIELAESKARRRQFEALVRRLRDADAADAAVAAALERAAAVAGDQPLGPSSDASAAGAEVVPPPDPAVVAAEAEAAIDAGDTATARDRLLELARLHAAAGQPDAALDACTLALGIAPGDPEVHLAFVELYLDRGWRAAAVDKLALLGRLVELTGDDAARERVRSLAAERLPGEARLVTTAG